MDAALWLLWRLRLKAFFRRLGRSLRSFKGIVLSLVGLLCFVPWMMSLTFVPKATPQFDPALAQRFGSLVLLAFAILSLMFSSGERALFFSPAEVAFLFPGPFTRRSLLAFKTVGLVFGCVFSGLFMVMAFGRVRRGFFPSYVATTSALLFFQLMAMVVGLASNTVAAFAIGFRRKVTVICVGILLIGTLVSVGSPILRMPPMEALKALESSPVIQVASAPFRPFVSVFTAESLGPAFIGWTAVCFGMIGAMLAVVFAIDAQYLETAATSSARIYEKIQKMRKSGGVAAASAGPKSTRFRLAMFPQMSGIGPILWRQCLTAGREPVRVLLTWSFLLFVGGMLLYTSRNNPDSARQSVYVVGGISLWMALFLSPLIAFDFRGDLDRMEELKTLPTHPVALVLGQLLTPVLIFTIPQCILFVATSVLFGRMGLDQWAALGFVFPTTFLMFGIENLLFLLFPTRSTVANPADFTAFGRQILLMFSKILGVVLTIGASALMGVGAFYLLGFPRLVCVAISLGFAIGFASALVPLLVLAFQRYDVARDTPA